MLYQQTRDRGGVPSEMWEEATWLGGRTCLLFGSTMKLGREEETEENLRETPTGENTKGRRKNRSRILQRAKIESPMTQPFYSLQLESRNLNKYFMLMLITV